MTFLNLAKVERIGFNDDLKREVENLGGGWAAETHSLVAFSLGVEPLPGPLTRSWDIRDL